MAGSFPVSYEKLIRSWRENADAWRDAVRSHGIESRRLVTDRAIVQAVLDQRPRTVLDVGCGEGWLARELAQTGVSVTGVDVSEPLIHAARELGGAEYFCGAYSDLAAGHEWSGRRFDAVVANYSLLDDRLEETLTALAAVLSIEGALVVQTVHPAFAGTGPCADGWRVETFQDFPGTWPEAMPWYFRTLESWTRAFAAAGFLIAEIREPMHPARGVPASIIFICRRTPK